MSPAVREKKKKNKRKRKNQEVEEFIDNIDSDEVEDPDEEARPSSSRLGNFTYDTYDSCAEDLMGSDSDD